MRHPYVQLFLTYMNSRHPNMTFTFENEVNNSLPFLDVKVIRSNHQFVTSIYRKPTFSGVYTNYSSYIPDLYKQNLVSTLLFRIFTVCSSWELMHREVESLKLILRKNSYPKYLTEKLVKKFFNKVKAVKTPVATVPKQQFTIVLPYLGTVTNKVSVISNILLKSTFRVAK